MVISALFSLNAASSDVPAPGLSGQPTPLLVGSAAQPVPKSMGAAPPSIEPASNRLEWEKRREEWRSLPAEERAKRLKEWRERGGTNRPDVKSLSPEQREAKRQEVRERFERQLKELLAKKAAGTLSSNEQRRLERMEEIAQRSKGRLAPPLAPAAPGKSKGGKPTHSSGDK